MAKLFLYSLAISPVQAAEISRMIGKKPEEISFALIENAADVVHNAADWLQGFRDMLRINGFRLELLDLRNWLHDPVGLYEQLSDKDVIWVGGGHTYYLRWILKETGADEIIKTLVRRGKVYAGWSAGAVVAGPSIAFFDGMGDDLKDAPEVIMEGLKLTDIVVVPHMDNKDFAADALQTENQLKQAGLITLMLNDNQALVIDGERYLVI